MSDREFLEQRFDKLNRSLKWLIGTALTVFFVFMGTFGAMALSNRAAIKEIDFDIMLLENQSEVLQYKQGWFIELNEVQRDFIKAYVKDEDVTDFMEQLNRMEKRIYAGEKPMPTLRGSQ